MRPSGRRCTTRQPRADEAPADRRPEHRHDRASRLLASWSATTAAPAISAATITAPMRAGLIRATLPCAPPPLLPHAPAVSNRAACRVLSRDASSAHHHAPRHRYVSTSKSPWRWSRPRSVLETLPGARCRWTCGRPTAAHLTLVWPAGGDPDPRRDPLVGSPPTRARGRARHPRRSWSPRTRRLPLRLPRGAPGRRHAGAPRRAARRPSAPRPPWPRPAPARG